MPIDEAVLALLCASIGDASGLDLDLGACALGYQTSMVEGIQQRSYLLRLCSVWREEASKLVGMEDVVGEKGIEDDDLFGIREESTDCGSEERLGGFEGRCCTGRHGDGYGARRCYEEVRELKLAVIERSAQGGRWRQVFLVTELLR